MGQDIITELSEIQTLTDVVNSSHFGLGVITSPIMLLFCVILMGYAVLKVFFANLKRGGILLIQIAVGQPLYVQRPTGLSGRLYGLGAAGYRLVPDRLSPVHHPHCGTHGVQGPRTDGRGAYALGGRVPRIAGSFGLDTTTKANITSAVYTAQAAVNTHPNHRRSDQMKG